MSVDKSLCPICAWRGDCKKKFNKGAGLNCPDFSRDLTVKNEELEAELDKTSNTDKGKKAKKGLWPM